MYINVILFLVGVLGFVVVFAVMAAAVLLGQLGILAFADAGARSIVKGRRKRENFAIAAHIHVCNCIRDFNAVDSLHKVDMCNTVVLRGVRVGDNDRVVTIRF